MARTANGLLLLEEAAALADAAYSDDADRARDLGWRPMTEAELGPLDGFEDGVQETTVGTEGGERFTSAAHAYVGEAEGRTTVAIAFRGTDQGSRELLFEIGNWDEYYDEHRELVDAVADFAAEGLRDGSVDQLLITGHSLGGTLAEEAAALGLDDPLVRRNATAITFGSPDSQEEVGRGTRLLNLVHTDDSIAEIGEYADGLPDWIDVILPGDLDRFVDEVGELERDGRDIEVSRPEGRGLRLGDAGDLVRALVDSDDWEDRPFLTEHDLDLYARTASELEGRIA